MAHRFAQLKKLTKKNFNKYKNQNFITPLSHNILILSSTQDPPYLNHLILRLKSHFCEFHVYDNSIITL